MDPQSKLWIYQANRLLTAVETETLKGRGSKFVQQWDAHGQPLSASFSVFYNRFVVIAVDEKTEAVSGCAIDRSVALMKSLGAELSVDFFDRMQVAYLENKEIVSCKMHDFWARRKANLVQDETLVFDNLVSNKADFDGAWQKPFAESWHAKMW